MKFKYKLLILIILSLFLINAVYGEDINSTDKLNTVEPGEIDLTEDIVINKTITVKNDLTINGNNHVLDGNHTTRIIKNSASLTVKNLIFKNANADRGSAIYNTGNLTLINCQFINNLAQKNGAAIYSTGPKLTITNSKFIKNRALSTDGGAIKTTSTTIIKDSNFENNLIETSLSGARGGAIYCTEDTTIINSIFKNNHCNSTYKMKYAHSKKYKSNGGAIYFSSGKHKVVSCKFLNNYVDNHGGAIFAYHSCKLEIDNSEFRSNKALYEDGGAISFCGKKLTINKSKFIKNYAHEDGGALDTFSVDKKAVYVSIKKSQFIQNTAHKGAGAVWLGVVTSTDIKNTDFRNNKASIGGALYIEGKTAKITKCKFIKNSVVQYTKYSKSKTVIKPSGGAIVVKAKVTLNKCELSKNTAKVAGGAIYNKGKLLIKSCKINNNKAQYGGAIHTSASCVSLTNCKLQNNVAGKNGGAIVVKSKITIKSSTITNNKAVNGGAIFNMGTISLSNTQLIKNKADTGGALFNEKGFVSLFGNLISSNSAKVLGGAIVLKAGKLSAKSNAFLYNKAKTYSAVYSKNKISLDNNWWGTTKDKSPSKKLTNVKVKKWLKLKITILPKKISKGKRGNVIVSLKLNNANKYINGVYKLPVKIYGKNAKLKSHKTNLNKGLIKVKFKKTSKKATIVTRVYGVKISIKL